MTAPTPEPPPLSRLGPQLALVVLVVATMTCLAAGAAAVTTLGADPPSSSRVATDRPCPDGPASAPSAASAPPRLAATLIGHADQPVGLALAPEGDGDGVLAERGGRLLRLAGGRLTREVVLDLASDTAADGDGGLLGVAYQPDGRWLYVYRTTADMHDEITAHPVDGEGRPRRGAGRVILHVERTPSKQHHGGSIAFDRDGMLYVGLGDGGGLGDPQENAQDPSTPLGKVLRIDPTPDGRQPYRVPPDNPFVGSFGWAPEAWVLGVRNPFRMSVDAATGDLWLGDVGQSCREEIDRLPTGEDGAGGSNLGWDRVEGDARFEGGTLRGAELRPVHTYSHAGGRCAIVVGYVIRGGRLPDLDGWLPFSDYCDGRLQALWVGADADDGAALAEDAPPVAYLGIAFDQPVAIVAGPSGRPWVLSLAGSVYELTPS